MDQRALPANVLTEKSVISSMLLSADVAYQVTEILHHTDFYSTANMQIYIAITELLTMNLIPDLNTIANTLRVKNQLAATGGEEYLAEIAEAEDTATSTNPKQIYQWCKILTETHATRELILSCENIHAQCHDNDPITDVLQHAGHLIIQTENILCKKTEIESVGELLSPTLEEIEKYHTRSEITGVSTGIKSLDKITTGYQRGDLILIAARPGMGKTGLMLTTALNGAVINETHALILSLEMSKTQLTQRLIAMQADVNLHTMRAGKLTNEEYKKLGQGTGILYPLPIYIDDSTPTITEIRAKIRRMIREKNIGVAYIDYLQLIPTTGRTESRNQEIALISRSLKNIAKDFKIPVIALSQLSREVERRPIKQRRPYLSDLRDGGTQEQDADVVIFIYRPEVYDKEDSPGIAEILIGKQRNGPVGKCKVEFVKKCATFKNLANQDWDDAEQQDVWQNDI